MLRSSSVLISLTGSAATCHKSRRNGQRLLVPSLVLSLSLACVASASADDTEIFFSGSSNAGNNGSNVLFVLDTSGSMGAKDGGSESRMTRMKNGIRAILDQSTGVNVGLMKYNGVYGGGPILYPITPIDKTICASGSCPSGSTPSGTVTARDHMIEIVDSLSAIGGTPTIDSYYEAARYFRGETVEFGRQRGATGNSSSKKQKFRLSHPDSYTGGTVVRDSSCTHGNLNDGSCAKETISGSPVYVSPISNSCQANHIVLLSDGETDRNDVVARVRALTGTSSCAESGNEACATELASWLKGNDHSTSIGGKQEITTHTIAFNLDGSGKQFLERVAIAGGGGSHEADTANDLVGVFKDILTEVLDFETGFTAPAATVNQFNRLTHRDDIYFAMFKPESSARWAGNLKRFRVGKDGSGGGEVLIRDRDGAPAIDESSGYFFSSARSWWPERDAGGNAIAEPDGSSVVRGGAANQLSLTSRDGAGARRVYTWAGLAAGVPSIGVDLTDAAQALSESNASITDDLLGIAGMAPNAAEQSAYRQSLLQWARGVDVLDEDQDGSDDDIRAHMGDPMHAQPLVVNYADSSADGTRSIVFLATNEGFVHAIDTETGAEEYAFMPSELLSNLNTFMRNRSEGHPYGLDGPLSLYRTDDNGDSIINGSDKAYLYLAMRRGGQQYYALDISSPDAPRLAWAIQGGTGGTAGFEEMGQSWSRMSPVSIAFNGQRRDVLIFGGGNDVGQDPVHSDPVHALSTAVAGRAVYIVDALNGDLLWSGQGQMGGSQRFDGMEYSFPANLRSIDVNRDGLVDQIYAADTGGQLWRFDLAKQHESGSLMKGGIIAKLGDSPAEHQRRFFTEPDVSLINDEGQQVLTIGIGSGWRAHPLDDVIEDRFFVVRQASVRRAPAVYGKDDGVSGSGVTGPITVADLEPVAGKLTPPTNKYGWYLELPEKGEKVLGSSVTFDGTVIFSTYIPSNSTLACSASVGGGRAYVLDAKTGAPVQDLDKDGDVDVHDISINLIHGGIPPKASVLLTEAGGDSAMVFIGPQQIETGLGIQTQRTFWSDRGEAGDFDVVDGDVP